MTPEFIAGVIALISIVGAIYKVWTAIETKINDARHALEKDGNRSATELNTVREQLSLWQLEIVRSYATKAELEKLESRIVAAIERLEAKLEGYFKVEK